MTVFEAQCSYTYVHGHVDTEPGMSNRRELGHTTIFIVNTAQPQNTQAVQAVKDAQRHFVAMLQQRIDFAHGYQSLFQLGCLKVAFHNIHPIDQKGRIQLPHGIPSWKADYPATLDQYVASFEQKNQSKQEPERHHTEGAKTFKEALEHLEKTVSDPDAGVMTSMVVRDRVLPLLDYVSTVLTPPDKFEPANIELVSLERADELQNFRMIELEEEALIHAPNNP